MTKPFLFAALFVFGVSLTATAAKKQTSSGKKARAIFTAAPEVPAEARFKRLRGSGLVVFHVRPDGTVSRAEMRRSTGHAILDKACVDAFSKWRFVPGTLKEIKMPVTFTGNYTNTRP